MFIRLIACNFSPLDSLVVLYIAVTRSKLGYVSVAQNNLTPTDSSRTENTKMKFATLSYYRFLQPDNLHIYNLIMIHLNLKELYSDDNLILYFLFKFSRTKPVAILSCTLLATLSARQIREFVTFTQSFSCVCY